MRGRVPRRRRGRDRRAGDGPRAAWVGSLRAGLGFTRTWWKRDRLLEGSVKKQRSWVPEEREEDGTYIVDRRTARVEVLAVHTGLFRRAITARCDT